MSLTGDRAALADIVRAVVDTDLYNVYDHVPDAIATPAYVVAPADDYLAIPSEATFAGNEFVCSLYLYVLVDYTGANETAIEQLDKAIEQIAPNLGDWLLTAVAAPDTLTTGEWLAYGSRLTVQNLTSIGAAS